MPTGAAGATLVVCAVVVSVVVVGGADVVVPSLSVGRVPDEVVAGAKVGVIDIVYLLPEEVP